MATETSTAGYSRVIENLVLTSTLRLDGPEYDNTLIRNVTIKNVSGDGIFLRNVDNVRIENCTITNVSGVGIKLSSEGSTSNVTIEGNTISQIGKDGISAAQRESTGVDHPGLKIIDNHIDHAGTSGTSGLLHGIYVQSTDFLIEGNLVTNSVDGNGISVRSSGVVRDNMVDGAGKSGIGYYADHMRGPSNLLIIEDNVVANAGLRETSRHDIDLLNIPNTSYAVRNFEIRNNTVTDTVGVHKDYASLGAKTTVTGTNVVSVSQAESMISNWSPDPAPSDPVPTDPTPTEPPPSGGLTGTSGADNLTGTSGADTLNGLGGNDVLKGGAGGDTFVIAKGMGSDTILDFLPQYSDVIKISGYEYASFDQLKGKASQVGADTVIHLSTTETLTLKNVQVGDLGASEFTFDNVTAPAPTPVPQPVDGKEVVGTSGADVLQGGAGNDLLKGGAGGDTFVIKSGQGSDTVADFYPQYSDIIKLDGYALASFDQVKAHASQVGADTVIHLSTSETLTLKNVQMGDLGASEFTFANVAATAPAPAPTPVPVAGKEVTGTSGADVLQGGAGNDLLKGGAGGDTFVIAKGQGSDTILDFYPQYSDVIKLDGYALGSIDQVKAAAGQVGADTVIHLSTTETLTLKNVQVGDLGASEFTFQNVDHWLA